VCCYINVGAGVSAGGMLRFSEEMTSAREQNASRSRGEHGFYVLLPPDS